MRAYVYSANCVTGQAAETPKYHFETFVIIFRIYISGPTLRGTVIQKGFTKLAPSASTNTDGTRHLVKKVIRLPPFSVT
jgi:hypothetical protein